ncbi:i-AAA protease yme1 [Tulasnella sp. 417]|nr:i-AAA protease yme1 [Tulasnella sp. 417]
MQAVAWPGAALAVASSSPISSAQSVLGFLNPFKKSSTPAFSTYVSSNSAPMSRHTTASLEILAGASPLATYRSLHQPGLSLSSNTSSKSMTAQRLIYPFLSPPRSQRLSRTLLGTCARSYSATAHARNPLLASLNNGSRRNISIFNRGTSAAPTSQMLARIRLLEVDASSNPHAVEKQLALWNALYETGHTDGYNKVISQWERMCEFDPSSPLLHSEPAFETYLKSLIASGLMKAGPGQKEWEPATGKTVKFSDVHGVDEAKEDLEEIVEFLKDPTRFSTLGGRLPKGVLLTGPPGTGKTMLAKAVAGEAGVPFLFASGSEFDEIFVGTGAKRVRELFAAARKKQPAIIFIDELDAIGSKRSAKDQHYMKQTLNQLLVELDGFKESEGVIVIGATNFPESLDQALVRPGRFDKKVVVPLPDVKGRAQILTHHMRDVLSDVAVDPVILARGTTGFSGADLQNLVNQAAIQASREGAKHVGMKHFEWAKDKILMGAERRSAVISEKEKRMTAYHEAGHALVALYTEGAIPLHKVTCMPRGYTLGVTQFLPTDDRVSSSYTDYVARIDVSMGGRAAEEIIYGKKLVTSGCSSDLKNATQVATGMIRYYGYSEELGPVHFGDDTSPAKRGEIDAEIKRLLVDGFARAKTLLTEKEDELHKLADALVEYETLDSEEVNKVIKGEKIRQDDHELDRLREQLGFTGGTSEVLASTQQPPTP